MNGASSCRPERPAGDRFAALAAVVKAAEGYPDEIVLGTVPERVRGRMALSRLRPRLQRRFLRRAGAFDAPEAFGDATLQRFLEGGSGAVRKAAHTIGAECQAEPLARVIYVDARRRIAEDLGIDLPPCPEMARMRQARARLHAKCRYRQPRDTIESLVAAIRHDGWLCWMCWLDTLPDCAARALRYAIRVEDSLPAHGDLSRAEAQARALISGAKIAELFEDVGAYDQAAQ